MHQMFDLSVIFPLTIMIFFIGFFITYKVSQSFLISLFVSFIKSSIFFVYFLYFHNSSDILIDALKYFDISRYVLQKGFNWLDLFDDNFYLSLHYYSKSNHITYYVYSIVVMKLFGVSYITPIAINISILFIAGYFFYKIALKLNFTQKDSILLYLFLIFHLEILTWSSASNLKDILVLTLTIVLFYFFFKIEEKKDFISSLIFIIIIFFIFSSLRFYIPVLFTITIIIYYIYKIMRKVSIEKKILWITVVFIVSIPTYTLFIDVFSYRLDTLTHNFTNPLVGSFRFLLSPVPFNTEMKYTFLDLPMSITWILFIFFIHGFVLVLKSNNNLLHVLLIYFIILTLFYGMYGVLQGPRHRLQIIFIIILFQFISIKSILNYQKERYLGK